MINDTDGKKAEELDELLKEKEAKTQAILLEMVRGGGVLWFGPLSLVEDVHTFRSDGRRDFVTLNIITC